MQPLVDEDSDNIMWDECDSSEDSVPGGDLATSTTQYDQDTNVRNPTSHLSLSKFDFC